MINIQAERAGGVVQSTLLMKGDEDNLIEVSMTYDQDNLGPSIGVLIFTDDEGIRLNPAQIETLMDYLAVAQAQNTVLIHGPDKS